MRGMRRTKEMDRLTLGRVAGEFQRRVFEPNSSPLLLVTSPARAEWNFVCLTTRQAFLTSDSRKFHQTVPAGISSRIAFYSPFVKWQFSWSLSLKSAIALRLLCDSIVTIVPLISPQIFPATACIKINGIFSEYWLKAVSPGHLTTMLMTSPFVVSSPLRDSHIRRNNWSSALVQCNCFLYREERSKARNVFLP